MDVSGGAACGLVGVERGDRQEFEMERGCGRIWNERTKRPLEGIETQKVKVYM